MKKIVAIVCALLILTPLIAGADETSTKEQEIAQLDEKIKELTGDLGEVTTKTKETESQVAALKKQLEKAQHELKKTQLTITSVADEQEITEEKITTGKERLAELKERLAGLLRVMYQHEQESLIRLFFSTFSLSEVLAERATIAELQESAAIAVQEIKAEQDQLHQKGQELQEQEESLSQLQEVLNVQQNEVAAQEQVQRTVLNDQRVEQADIVQQLADAKQARAEIEKQVFALKSSNIEVSLNNAFDMARFSSSKTGVDMALLLAVLKVESNLGNNVGSGVYPNDMQPASRSAFVRITDKLGLNRNTAPISRRPSSGKGWGGAIGPAQFMPATWEGIEPRVEQLMGKSPVNPYDLPDAFMGTAIYLADRGANNPDREREALARYVAGPYWQYHVNGWYVERVMAVKAEYAKEL